MSRIVIIGNSGGSKSTLARTLARRRGLRHVEIDQLLWQEGWELTPTDIYMRQHIDIIQGDGWIIDGLGQQASIFERFSRATEIILIDLPLWVHFWLAAERQIAWASGILEHAPGSISQMPSTKGLFQTMWDVEQNWMPSIRATCVNAEAQGKTVTRLVTLEQLDAFANHLAVAK
jgi:hypothetical protein